VNTPGEVLFARYAYAPNDLGYCGPGESEALAELGSTGATDADVTAIAKRFSGAWPYAAVLAQVAGIADPLDERVMRAYWTGRPLLDAGGRKAFALNLVNLLASQAGHYWSHLTPDLLPEVTPTHGFHVFGVYPWSRLLDGETFEQPLRVLDDCRIRWGQVIGVDGEQVRVHSERLVWDGSRLRLGRAGEESVRFALRGRSFVVRPAVGDWLALHWDWACDRLSGDDVAHLRSTTELQLALTNARLARAKESAA
jgi:hypothetical protein